MTPTGAAFRKNRFDVQVSDFGDQRVVAVRGAIDLVTGPVLWELLVEAIDEAKPRVVVLSLTSVPFIDSTELGVFVRVFKRLRHEGADVLGPPPARPATYSTSADSTE